MMLAMCYSGWVWRYFGGMLACLIGIDWPLRRRMHVGCDARLQRKIVRLCSPALSSRPAPQTLTPYPWRSLAQVFFRRQGCFKTQHFFPLSNPINNQQPTMNHHHLSGMLLSLLIFLSLHRTTPRRHLDDDSQAFGFSRPFTICGGLDGDEKPPLPYKLL
jgi:hypothetical protein